MKDLNVNQAVLPVAPIKKYDPVKEKLPTRESVQSGDTTSKLVEQNLPEKHVSSEKVTEEKEVRKEKPKGNREVGVSRPPTSANMLEGDSGTKTPPRQMMSFSEISHSAKAKSKAGGIVDDDDDCMIVDSPSFSSWRQCPEPGRDRNVGKSLLAPKPAGTQVITVGRPLGGATSEGAAKTQLISIIKKPGDSAANTVTVSSATQGYVNQSQPLCTTSSLVSVVKPVGSSQDGASSVASTNGGVGNFDVNVYIRTMSEKDRLSGVLAKQTVSTRMSSSLCVLFNAPAFIPFHLSPVSSIPLNAVLLS